MCVLKLGKSPLCEGMEDRDIKPAERACRGLRFEAVTRRHGASPLLSLGFVVHSNSSGVHGYKAVVNQNVLLSG